MKIIAVNIGKSLSKGNTVINSTRRAWKLDLEKANGFDKVISIDHGIITGYFNLAPNGVRQDSREPNRVYFNLTPCTSAEKLAIDSFIKVNRINLSGFVTKYIF